MKITNKNYPHPVMDKRRDDIQPFGFSWDIKIRNDKVNYYFDYNFTVQNKTIEDLLKTDRARFVLHVECSSTFYREAFKILYADRFVGTITIHGDNLVGRVEISIFICSDSQISEYAPAGMHSDYEGLLFEVGKGDFLAVGDTHIEPFFKDYDPIKKVSSIIEFRKDTENKTGPIMVDCNANKICALLPEKLYTTYLELREDPSKTNTIATLLVLPVLMEGLQFLKDNLQPDKQGDLGSLQSLRWFRSVEQKLKDIQFNILVDSPFVAAQKLLELPYDRTSQELGVLSAISRDAI